MTNVFLIQYHPFQVFFLYSCYLHSCFRLAWPDRIKSIGSVRRLPNEEWPRQWFGKFICYCFSFLRSHIVLLVIVLSLWCDECGFVRRMFSYGKGQDGKKIKIEKAHRNLQGSEATLSLNNPLNFKYIEN